MKKKLRIMLIALAALVFVGSGALILGRAADYRRAENLYAELRAEVGTESAEKPLQAETVIPDEVPPLEAEPVPEVQEQVPLAEEDRHLLEMDLSAAMETNPDVLGWISIPGTRISYPLLRGEDNSEYLHSAWDGSYSSAGSIFLECMNSPDFSDFNTILYGHNMKNGSMFAELNGYQHQSYLEAHPLVYIRTTEGLLRYEVFAAYEAPVESDTYRLYFEDDARREDFLAHTKNSSVLETELKTGIGDRILTLSTCTGSGYGSRWVVQAVLTGYFEV